MDLLFYFSDFDEDNSKLNFVNQNDIFNEIEDSGLNLPLIEDDD